MIRRDVMSAALLIVDMQEAFSDMRKANDSIDKSIGYINATSKLFREKNLPVILVKAMPGGDPEGYGPLKGLVISDGDIIVEKHHMNAFYDTELDEILKDKGVKFVVLAGMAAEYCLLFSYNGALEKGYQASILQHGVVSTDMEEVKRMQYLRPVISAEALYALL